MDVRYSNFTSPRSTTLYLRFDVQDGFPRERAPLLERLLARAQEAEPAPDWRRDAFRLIAPVAPAMPGIGACALLAACGADSPREGYVLLATPVSYQAEMSNVRMTDAGIIALDAGEAQTLARDFNGAWGDARSRLIAAPHRLFLHLAREARAATHDPVRVRGRHIHDFLPSGQDAGTLRRLMSEMEMWLFEHEINRRRTSDGRPTLSGLWLWGGGPALEALPAVEGAAAGDDVFFGAFASSSSAVPPTVIAVSARPGGPQWGEIEARWLAPAVRELRAGRIGSLRLSADQRCYRVIARGLSRFWRRPRPWWEYFE